MFSCNFGGGGTGVDDPPAGGGGEKNENAVWSSAFDTVFVIDEATDEMNELKTLIYTLTGKAPALKDYKSEASSHEIVFGECDRPISKTAYSKLDRYADLFSLERQGKSAYYIYAEGGSIAIAYSDVFAKKQAIDYILEKVDTETYAPEGLVARGIFDTIEYIEAVRAAEQEQAFALVASLVGESAIASLKNLYTLYGHELYICLANLYDPDIGGFYYSASARDNVGFLPDLESTAQALGLLERSGLATTNNNNWVGYVPDDIASKILAFAMGLQASDGYFYHPQWGTGITSSRRGRDAGWARSIITDMGAEPKYPFATDAVVNPVSATVTGRLGVSGAVAVSKVVSTAADDSIYASEAAFIAYLDSLKINENSYSAGNTLNATSGMITAKKLRGTLDKYLRDHQNPKNGLWEEEVTYQSVNGLMKLCGFFGKDFPNAEKALNSAMTILMLPIDDELTGITFVYNPWVAISHLLGAVDDATKATLRQTLCDNATEIFNMTAEKLGAFAKSDGGFSYLRDYSSPFSQSALVAVSGSAESDVNATSIAISTIVTYMDSVFGVAFPQMYGSLDGVYFVETLKSMKSIIKSTQLAQDPEVITFDDFNEEEGQISGNMVLNPHPDITVNIGDDETLDNNYIWVESAIVKNPTEGEDTKDLVYYFKDKVLSADSGAEKTVATTASSQEFKITNYAATGNCYIFEADMLFGGVGNTSEPAVQLTFIRDNSALISAWVDIYQYTRFGKNYLRISDYFAGHDGIKNSETVAGIPVDDWFKLRIEVYKDYSGENGELMTKMKFFVNGEYAGSSDSGHYASGAYKDFMISAVKLSYYRHSESALYINNVYVAKSGAVYKDEALAGFDSDEISGSKVTWDFEDGIPSEDNNFSEMFYEDEQDGYTSINPVDWTADLDSVFKSKHGTKLYSDKDPLDPTNLVIRAYSQNSKKSQYKATMYVNDTVLAENANTLEIEFDYYFEKIKWTYADTLFSINMVNEHGTSLAAVSFVALDWSASHSTNTLGIKIGNTTVEGFNMRSDRWYSFKIVYHHNMTNPEESRALVYVLDAEGEYVCVANQLLTSVRDTISGVALSFHCYDIRGTQYIDDLSVSRTALEYTHTTPVPGEDVEIPLPDDDSIKITESQRGEGQYKDGAISYSSTTIEALIKDAYMVSNTVRGDGVAVGKRTLSITADKDPALVYASLGSGNHAINFVTQAFAYEGFIFETDVMLDGVDSEEGRDIRFTGTKTGGSSDASLYAFNVKFHLNADERIGGYALTINGSDQKINVPDKTWINIRLHAEGLKKGSALKLYVNGDLLITTTLTDSIEGIVGVELYTPSTYGGHGWEKGSISLDNTYVSGYGKAPQQLEIVDSSRGNGSYKDSAISFDSVSYVELIKNGLMAENTKRGDGVLAGNRTISLTQINNDGALVYAALASGIHSLNFVSRNEAADGFIFEADIKLDGIDAMAGRDIRFTGSTTNGTADAALWAFNIKIAVNPDSQVGGYILTLAGSETQVLLKDGVWNNIYYVATGLESGSAAHLYVNDTYITSAELTASIRGIKGVELYTASTYNGVQGWTKGTISIDNLYVSGTGSAPKPEQIVGSSRGEGANKDKAITYSGYTYEALASLAEIVINKNRGDGVSAGNRTLSFVDYSKDTVLKYSAFGSGNHAFSFVTNSDKAFTSFVFETDLMLSGVNAESGRDIRFTGSKSRGVSDAALWDFNLKISVNPDKEVGGYIISLNGCDRTLLLADSQWINIRLVAEGVNEGDALKLFVNGELALSANLTSSIKGINSVEMYTASTYGGKQGWTEGSIYLDNTFVGGGTDAVTPDPTPDPTPTPKPDTGNEEEVGNNGENIDPGAWVK